MKRWPSSAGVVRPPTPTVYSWPRIEGDFTGKADFYRAGFTLSRFYNPT